MGAKTLGQPLATSLRHRVALGHFWQSGNEANLLLFTSCQFTVFVLSAANQAIFSWSRDGKQRISADLPSREKTAQQLILAELPEARNTLL